MKLKSILKDPMKLVAVGLLILIVTTGIILKTHPIKVIPLCISCFVMLLQSKVNRFAFLVGGLNSILYGFSSILMQLYAGAASAFLVSFPLQILTFINWNKNTHGGVTETKKLTTKKRIGLFALMAGAWLVLYILFSSLGSPFIVLDNTATVLGVVTTVLCMIRYSEYAILQFIGSLISLALNISVSLADITNVVSVFMTVYSLVCTAIAFFTMNKRSVVK